MTLGTKDLKQGCRPEPGLSTAPSAPDPGASPSLPKPLGPLTWALSSPTWVRPPWATHSSLQERFSLSPVFPASSPLHVHNHRHTSWQACAQNTYRCSHTQTCRAHTQAYATHTPLTRTCALGCTHTTSTRTAHPRCPVAWVCDEFGGQGREVGGASRGAWAGGSGGADRPCPCCPALCPHSATLRPGGAE